VNLNCQESKIPSLKHLPNRFQLIILKFDKIMIIQEKYFS